MTRRAYSCVLRVIRVHSGASVMLAMTDVLANFFLESDIAQNLHVQIERAYFSPTEYVFRRSLVVSKVKSYCFKACKPCSQK